MKTRPILLLLTSALLPTAHASSHGKVCHCLPSDSCWPAKSAWDALNSTVNGRLVATVVQEGLLRVD